jgi:hypothetical protein
VGCQPDQEVFAVLSSLTDKILPYMFIGQSLVTLAFVATDIPITNRSYRFYINIKGSRTSNS